MAAKRKRSGKRAPEHPRVERGEAWARAVVRGRIPACRWARLACARHFADKRRARSKAFRWRFDPAKAERSCRFIELLPHTKGTWAASRDLIELAPWQAFVVASLFGWVAKSTGLRRFWRALILVPRKNGKSTLAAGIGLYMLVADREAGAEVYAGATTERQAWEVFRPARLMALHAPQLRSAYGLEVNKANLNVGATASRFEPIIGKPGDGASPSCAIHDEYHEHDTDEQVDAMATGMGARAQPLQLIITTAGSNLGGPCYQLMKDGEKVLAGVLDDDGTFFVNFTLDDGDDWTSPGALAKANPNHGISVGAEFLERRRREALASERKRGAYKTKHLNLWVGARTAWFDVQRWQAAANPELTLEDQAGRPCWLGLDLASKVDVAALVALFPRDKGGYRLFSRFWLPEAALDGGASEHYRAWAEAGRLSVTDGEIIDFEAIEADILALWRNHDVREVAYDPHQATMLVTRLMGEGVPVIEVRPTVLSFSEPMKTLDALIRAGQVEHDGCPVMTWMIANVTAKLDAKDNVYPRKERPEAKIDGPVAALMALARATSGEGQAVDLSALILERGGFA